MALTTLSTLKQWLGVSGAADDALMTRLIAAISAASETYMNRKILSASHSITLDGTGGDRIMLPNYPVTAITSLAVSGIAVAAAAGQGDGYIFDEISVTYQGGLFPRGRSNLAITYVAGYAECPMDIEQAVLESCALRYRERDRIGHTSKSVAGETVSFFTGELPKFAKHILDNYRDVVPR